MTPLQIDILFWYRTRARDYRDGDMSAPAVREAIDEFNGNLGMLEARQHGPVDQDYRSYQLTPRGEAYLDALMNVPLPVCKWVIPAPSLNEQGGA